MSAVPAIRARRINGVIRCLREQSATGGFPESYDRNPFSGTSYDRPLYALFRNSNQALRR